MGSPHRDRGFRSLTGRAEFARVYQEGWRRREGDVVVVSAGGEPGLPQVAFVAGRRVGSAVRRNRAKRRLRAATQQVPVPPGTAHVVIAGPQVPDVAFPRLVRWLSRAMEDQASRAKEEPA